MLYTRPQIAPEDMAAFYPAAYSAHAPDRAARHAVRRRGGDPWDADPPHEGAALLDVGCGSGAYLLRQQARGWVVAGIEPSRRAVDAAQRMGLHDVRCCELAGAELPSGAFHLVTLLGVLDHIAEPLPALRALCASCAPGGRCVVTVPNAAGAAARLFGASWPGWDLPRHQNHFATGTLRRLLEEAGFINVTVTGKRRTSHWRRAARIHADAIASRWWVLVARSRNLAGIVSRIQARGEMSDDLVAVAVKPSGP